MQPRNKAAMLVVYNRIFVLKNLHENRVYFPEERNAFVLDDQHGRPEVTCKPAIRGTNSYSSYYCPGWQVSKGEGKVGKGISGRSWDWNLSLMNRWWELLYGYMTCDLRLFVDYPPERPLTRLRLAINLIPLSALNFDFLHRRNVNFLHCLGITDVLSANERAEIFACLYY